MKCPWISDQNLVAEQDHRLGHIMVTLKLLFDLNLNSPLFG